MWPLVQGKERENVTGDALCVINNILAARDLAAEGLGIVLIPHSQAAPLVDQGRLVQVLKDWERVPVPVSALFTSSRYMSPKVKAFVDLAISYFKSARL